MIGAVALGSVYCIQWWTQGGVLGVHPPPPEMNI